MERSKYLILGFALLAFVGCKDEEEMNYPMNSAKFMQQIASSSNFEISTGRLATERAMHEDVMEFGAHMVHAHDPATASLITLATQKKVTLPDTMDVDKRQRYQTLNQLTGVDFDKKYIDEMVTAHTMDVAKFDSASRLADDVDVRSWAGRLLPSLKKHLAESQTLNTITDQQ